MNIIDVYKTTMVPELFLYKSTRAVGFPTPVVSSIHRSSLEDNF